MPIDDRTSTQNYPKPNIANTLADDVGRLRTALDDIDEDMAAKAPTASPAFTGTPSAPTAAADTNTTQLATTAFVVGQAGSTSPSMDGTATVGSSLKYARADHVHPTDTSRATSTHVHGNITNAGAVGSTANLPIITTTSGVLTTGSFGTAANTFCQGNDSRLSDTRIPTDGSVTTAKIGDDQVTYAKIQNVSATDRLLGRSTAGAGDVEEITCTAAGRNLLDDADAAAQRTTLGLGMFDPAESTAAPNATVPVESLTATNSGFADLDIAFVAKGQGATLAQVPDSGTGGGNKRGIFATDWQKARTNAAHIASGSHSTICGGRSNTASGQDSFVGGGNSSTASGAYSAVLGGDINTANGFLSTVVGGRRGITRSITGLIAFPACSVPIAASNGVSQAALLILGTQTTDATTTTLRSDTNAAATGNQLTLANNAASFVRGSIIATVTGGGNTKAWTFEGAIKRGANAAATSIVGTFSTNVIAADSGASAWTIALSADTTNGCLKVEVTGQAATTIRWVCKLETTEVTF